MPIPSSPSSNPSTAVMTSSNASTGNSFLSYLQKEYLHILWNLSKFAFLSFTSAHIFLRTCSEPQKYVKAHKKTRPETISDSWCPDSVYEVFFAIVDTLIPSLTVNECSKESIQALLTSMDENFHKTKDILITFDYLMSHRPYLAAGAIEFGTHKHALEALQNLTTKAELQKLSMILKVMGTSLGNWLVTGYPAPFQVFSSLLLYSLFSLLLFLIFSSSIFIFFSLPLSPSIFPPLSSLLSVISFSPQETPIMGT